MENNCKCPVCGKPGIPDYHEEDIICPQCGSDLSIFRVIDQIPDSKHKKNIWLPIAIVAILATVALAIVLPVRIGEESRKIETKNNEITLLQDSVNYYKNKLANIPERQSSPVGSNEFIYIVRKGDSFWSISKRFYNTGTRYDEIIKANGLSENSKLNVGDTIKIKQ